MIAPIYVINLDHAIERRQHSYRILNSMGLKHEIFAAVDGNNMTDIETNQYRAKHSLFKFAYNLISGEIGCYLSHLQLWQKIIDDGSDGAFIFEDDFEANKDLPEVLDIISRLKTNSAAIIKLHDSDLSLPIKICPITDKYKLIIQHCVPYRTTAYYINRKAAIELIMKHDRKKFHRPVDDDLRYRLENKVEIVTISPSPVTHDINLLENSTITPDRDIARSKYYSNKLDRIHLNIRDKQFKFMNKLYILMVKLGMRGKIEMN